MKQVAVTQTLPLIPKKATFLQKSPYRHLLNDPNFNRPARNLMRGSTATAAERFRRMARIACLCP